MDAEDDLYDEFGNYIGPDQEDEDLDGEGVDDEEFDALGGGGLEQDIGLEEEVDPLGHGDIDADSASGAGDTPGEQAAAAGGEVPAGSYANAIVLHEDRQLYPSAEQVFPGVEAMVEEEDAMSINEPIIAPVKTRLFSVLEREVPATTYSADFLGMLLAAPLLQRNVAVMGHLHHGKTGFVDMLVESTHTEPWPLSSDRRYTDARQDEQDRGVSIQATPVTLVLPTLAGKHYAVTLVDCPGHPAFEAEAVAACRLCDGAVVVVDAVEGAMLGTERSVRRCVQAGLAVTLAISKVDRLILELRLPPKDAYWKLQRLIDEVNACIVACAHLAPPGYRLRRLSPARGNVVLCSAKHRWCISLDSFARAFIRLTSAATAAAASGAVGSAAATSAADEALPADLGESALAARLWGDHWWDPARGCILRRRAPAGRHPADWPRTFVHFVLEPIYKVYAHALGQEPSALAPVLAGVGVRLSKEELRLDPVPLLRACMKGWLGSVCGATDMFVARVPSPLDNAAIKAALICTGPSDSPTAAAVRACDADGPLVVSVVKLHAEPDGKGFVALARVFSGTARAGQSVRVLGEAYSPADDEDEAAAAVSAVCVGQARYRIGFSQAPAGAIVLLEGVEATIAKTATIVAPASAADAAAPSSSSSSGSGRAGDSAFAPGVPVHPLKRLPLEPASVMRVSLEPLRPAELPKLVSALRSVTRSYLQAETKAEESGEHVLMGTGEIMLDCAMHDLREMFGNGLEVRVSDPVATLRETVAEASRLRCFAASPNGKNTLTMLAEPLTAELADEVESGSLGTGEGWDTERTQAYLQEAHGWDVLAARGLWAFGPGSRGGNALVDDTMLLTGAGGLSPEQEAAAAMLSGARTAIVQGFDWAVKEGPLCEEPVRGVQLRLLDASLAATPLERSLGQLMPAARRAAYSAFLMAEPRLMEPMMEVEVLAPLDVAPAVQKVLKRRRGHIVADAPKPGSPFFVLRGYVPVMDSFGLETDLRVHTSGQAMVLQVFHHWDIVPGDPLDASIELRPLEPQPTSALAREFMVKTRRRKGLTEDVTVQRFFDEALLVELARHQATVDDAEQHAREAEEAAGAGGYGAGGYGAGGYGAAPSSYGYGRSQQ